MEKIIKIDDRDVKFKCSASFVYRYKAQFGKDVLKTIMPLIKGVIPLIGQEKIETESIVEILQGSSDFELTDVYNIVWVLAKTADNDIPEPAVWYDEFETFPLVEVITELIEILIPSLLTTKESKKKIVKMAK